MKYFEIFKFFLIITFLFYCGGKRFQDPLSFQLENLAGEKVSLKNYQGKIILIDFWATWCPPCRAAIPHLVNLYEKFENRNFVVLGIGLDEKELLIKMKEEMNIKYPILIGNNEIAKFYQVQAIPTLVLLDKNGKIYYREVGFSEEGIKKLELKILELLE
ncbi:MAG: TlpA family protein disulfide reductase [candidate division WOR-3 bacterium]|nr:TlpA family protein disulfide reductase [candidate division WOR-3 bacterium]MCX7837562.1 TlpA family protein disulfide reductase [candidate division WOR-3 bacterium]MDW8113999.1 TlpA disulfide reductase family protein [candidate division WOR-3 bacterium]